VINFINDVVVVKFLALARSIAN